MKKSILVFLIVATSTHAELKITTNDSISDHIEVEEQKTIEIPDDVVGRTKNYASFKVGLFTFYTQYKKEYQNKNFSMVCTYQKMLKEFLINNIGYADQYNKERGNPNAYQELLHAISSDSLANKKGCDGEAYFIK